MQAAASACRRSLLARDFGKKLDRILIDIYDSYLHTDIGIYI